MRHWEKWLLVGIVFVAVSDSHPGWPGVVYVIVGCCLGLAYIVASKGGK